MCKSLIKFNYEVSLIVADGKKDEIINGIKVYDVGKSKNRLFRIIFAPFRVYKKALSNNSQLYQFHDPELFIVGLMLKFHGKKIIFDSHEDVPNQMLDNSYLAFFIRYPLSKMIALLEKIICPRLDGIVAATPTIRKKFKNTNLVDIKNFPSISQSLILSNKVNSKSICYAGSISKKRGIMEIVESLHYAESKIRLSLAGNFNQSKLKENVMGSIYWDRVDYFGYLNRDKIFQMYNESFAGLVILHPTICYIDSLPIKMFEYMLSGLPVIASNFQLLREILEGNDCGFCVDPFEPKEIGKAINYLYENPAKANEMGQNGRKLIEKKYNWQLEENKLDKFYKSVLK